MEDSRCSKCRSRLSAAHMRVKILPQLHGWRPRVVQSAALASAPRTFVLEVCNSSKEGGLALFKVQRRSLFSAAHIRLKSLQQ
eukprot:7914951-Pyramimonas_sp.AAC.1